MLYNGCAKVRATSATDYSPRVEFGLAVGDLTRRTEETMLGFEDVAMATKGVTAMADRPDLMLKIEPAVKNAYSIQRSTEFARAMEGNAPLDVVVCLGHGRCLYPRSGSEKRHCAFCKVMPAGFIAGENSAELVRQFVRGN